MRRPSLRLAKRKVSLGARAKSKRPRRSARAFLFSSPAGAVAPDLRVRRPAFDGGFNEWVTRWHADHVYRHEPTALLIFLLPAMRCLNVFLAFYRRDLKPAARQAASRLHER